MLRGIKKLDLFVSRQFGLLFVGTFLICQFVLMMQFLWRYIEDVIGKGLSLDVLAQFFWYMGLMLVPQALPLAILLSTLITFGNLGESSELTAIKAAGISLMQTFRPLIVLTVGVTLASFYFQNNVGPMANFKLTQLLISMKQKSPELEIPEGRFYDGIPNSNIYVQRRDLTSGHLYGIMIYRMSNSFEDASIILADSGMLQSTAEKKHLLLTLWSGEWFENMQSQQVAGSAAVPYRRESFVSKQILMDFDADFSITDAASLSNNARGKSLAQIHTAIDSLNAVYDSTGRAAWQMARTMYYTTHLSTADSLRALQRAKRERLTWDEQWKALKNDAQRQALSDALARLQGQKTEVDFRAMVAKDAERILRSHKLEAINKFTLALQCLLFFFIGAPLGTIIRKGGLGVPIIVSVLVFIAYLVIDSTGFRMARGGMWDLWFGKLLATSIMLPLAAFVTYKAMGDSMVFNFDLWRDVTMRLLGLRLKRHLDAKEVVIEAPRYEEDCERLLQIEKDVTRYSQQHRLTQPPHPVKVFFRYKPDHEVERISEELERVVADLANTRSYRVLADLNQLPILATTAHTRPFERRWLNMAAAVLLPLGLFLYIRMWRFRLRLARDLKKIRRTAATLRIHIKDEMQQGTMEKTAAKGA